MKIIAEYIWIDGYQKLRSKTKVFNLKLDSDMRINLNINTFPLWNYDGSSTNQAEGSNSEIVLKPVQVYKDPFRQNTNNNNENNYLVLCETYNVDGTPTITNTRNKALQIFNKYENLEPMYGIEQEFFISKNSVPVAFINNNEVLPQKNYYCGVGGDNIYYRNVIEEIMNNCLYSKINLTGLNSEVAPSQWEFQVCNYGIEAADQLIMLRYIINRTLEKYDLNMDLHPKPIKGDWNGSGCHVNFSTNTMRQENGYENILSAIKNLEKYHKESIKHYGEDNHLRLTGLHETSSMDTFSYGVANRGASVRIPRTTEENKCGYFEDRRPSSNMDPYLVTSIILEISQKSSN